MEPPSPHQRWRLDTNSYFEPIGISEVPSELELRTNQVDATPVEIEDLQDDEFVRNFNSPLTDLNDPLIFQVRPFNSPVIGVLVGRLISSAGESPSTSSSVAQAEGVPPPPEGAPRENIPTTPLTPASRVVRPSASTNVVGTSGGVVNVDP